MVREPSAELIEVARDYVCVRVTDMSHVDLDVFQFDFDLTFAVLLSHADGTIYHRFGGRDEGNPLDWNTMPLLARLMRATLPEHRAMLERARTTPVDAATTTPRYVVDLEPLARKRAKDPKLAASCVHCHTVHDTLHALARDAHTLRADDIFVHPSPTRIGLTVATDDQALVTAVAPESPAAHAGLQSGDRLLRVGVQARILTLADIGWALHNAAPGATTLPIGFARDGAAQDVELALEAGWKRCSSEEYAWRPYKWNLSPAPGFGGPLLKPTETSELGLAADAFAFRVQYLVDWGERAHRGRAAAAAGLRRGDVVIGFAGRSDFRSMDHFHSFVRLELAAGQRVAIDVLRDGERIVLHYPLPE